MIDAQTLDKAFLSTPGEDLVDKTIQQLKLIPQMTAVFGQSFANYARFDWPIHELPAMNVFESGAENQSSDNGYLTGSVQIQVYWPPEFRRSDLARVPNVFKGVLENFFSSHYVGDMLDELASVQRDAKVAGLNEYGKMLTWTPNTGAVNSEVEVPATILDVQYRIDLRSFERTLEYQGRTKADPFETTLGFLSQMVGNLTGVDNNTGEPALVTVPFSFET